MFNLFTKKNKIQPVQQGVWIVPDFLAQEQCDAIIDKIETRGFKRARQYEEGRQNKETFITDNEVLDLLLERFKNFVLTDGTSKYTITNVSLPLEFFKYDTGDFIKRHSDAQRAGEGGKMSALTLVLYLNDDYKGGETFFNDLNYKTAPRAGHALFFKQELHHEALCIGYGTKYILRTNCFVA